MGVCMEVFLYNNVLCNTLAYLKSIVLYNNFRSLKYYYSRYSINTITLYAVCTKNRTEVKEIAFFTFLV